MKHTICAFAVIAAGGLAGGVPDYYRVIAPDCPLPLSELAMPVPAATGDTEWAINGVGKAVRPEATPRGAKEISVFLLPGEFRGVLLSVRPGNFPARVALESAPLKQLDGTGEVGAENFYPMRAQWYLKRSNWDDSRHIFLSGGDSWSVDTAQTVWVWISLHAPEGTPAGEYEGNFTLLCNGKKEHIPVRLRVLAGKYQAPEGAWGMFIPGHFAGAGRGSFENMAPAWWTEENLEMYYRFLATRGFNSPILFHVYGDMAMNDGTVTSDFPYLARTAEWMAKYGMAGPLGVDLRNLSWWSYAAARELEKQGVTPDQQQGDLGIYGYDGLNLGHTPGVEQYPELTRELYRKVLQPLADWQQQHPQIRFLYLTEEEIGYPTIKTKGYEWFNPVTEEVVGHANVMLVDNAVGYAYSAIERAARDHIDTRSYNNWTEEALLQAHQDGADVWYYNGGWNRQFAPYLIRIGARAYHQWADGWETGGPWFATHFDRNGVNPTLGLERTAEGLSDLVYFRALEQYRDRCRAQGLADEAERLQMLWDELFNHYPVNSTEYATAAAQLDDAALDRMRWRCVLAVSAAQQALGETPWFAAVAPTLPPEAVLIRQPEVSANTEANSNELLRAIIPAQAPRLDGKNDDAAWQGRMESPFHRTRTEEARLRAWASSEEEYRNMPIPSAASAGVVYDREGIYLWAGGNHSDPAGCRHGDDDPAIWEDDDFEFFFQPEVNGPVYQLLVSMAGKRTLLRDGRVIAPTPIRVAQAAPLNPSGGAGLEIFVPWSVFGLDRAPAAGSSWNFNVCRAFHVEKQFTSWTRVEERFGIGAGQLYFAGAALDGKLKVADATEVLLPGRNRITATLSGAAVAEKPHCELLRPDGSVAAAIELDGQSTTLELMADIAPETAEGIWRLHFTGRDGAALGELPLTFRSPAEALQLHETQLTAVNASPVTLTLLPGRGDITVAAELLRTTLEGNGRTYTLPEVKLQPGINRLELLVRNLPPGDYRLKLNWADWQGILPVKVLPSPWRL